MLSGLVLFGFFSLPVKADSPLKTIVSKITAPIIPVETAYQWTDAHVHVVDFKQKGDGLHALLQSMDENNIGHAMIAGIGVKKKWSEQEPQKPKYYLSDSSPVYWYSATDHYLLEDYKKLTPQQQRRLHPFISGFNPTDLGAAAALRAMLKSNPKTWQGIGEIFTRHDDLSMITEGEKPRADHEALLKVYQLAAEYDLPVLLHSNLTSKKNKSWLYLDELKNALESAPNTRFILAHAGTSGTLHRWQTHENLHILLGRLLQQYPNLWIDLSWSVLDPYIIEMKTPEIKVEIKKTQRGVNTDWIKLIEQYPERFMIGSDVVGRYKSQGEHMRNFSRLFKVLKPTTAKAVARDNFLNLLPKWVEIE